MPSAQFNVRVGRFGTDPISVRVSANSTVKIVLQKAEMDLTEVEKIFLNGETAPLSRKVKRGDIVSIVSPKEAGKI